LKGDGQNGKGMERGIESEGTIRDMHIGDREREREGTRDARRVHDEFEMNMTRQMFAEETVC